MLPVVTHVSLTLEQSLDFGSETAVQLMSWRFQKWLLCFLKAPFSLFILTPQAAVSSTRLALSSCPRG